MPAYSQNGYLANDRSCIHTVTVPGTSVKLPVRKGPAGDLLVWAASRWHREVEPLTPGWCWGFAERLIRGSSTELSNHASGTAIDVNAPKHPLGASPASSFTADRIAAIHRIVADSNGCLRWGGDYGDPAHGGVAGSRPDSMHLEIVASEAACAAVLAAPSPQEDFMAQVPQGEWNAVRDMVLRAEPPWAGGVTDDQNRSYDSYMLAKRNNVEIHQCLLAVQRLASTVDRLAADLAALKAKYGI